MKLDIKKIKDYTLMNIGTGRESLALLNYNPKIIYHYDISKDNIVKFKKYLKKNEIKKIISRNCDIVNYKLPSNKFDLIYTHGVVQHFSNPEKGILNCINSLKVGGVFWLYFYRSGTFQHFVNSMIRTFTKKIEIKNFYKYLLLKNKTKSTNLFISALMDSAFVDYYNLYHPKSFLNFIKNSGLRVINSSKLSPYKDKVNHRLHPSTILICKKTKEKFLNKKLNILTKKKSIDQLDINLYSKKKDIYIRETLYSFFKFKKKFINLNYIDKYQVIIKLFDINMKSYNNYIKSGSYKDKFYHKKLIEIFDKNY